MLISGAILISAVGVIYMIYDKYSNVSNFTKDKTGQILSIETFNQALERPEDNLILNSIVNANGGPAEYAKAIAPYDPAKTNLTEGLARDLYVAAQYSSIDKVVNSPELMAAALDKSLRDYTSVPAVHEIKTSDKMALSEIRAYGDGVGAMIKYLNVMVPALLLSADDMIQNKESSRLSKIPELAKKATDLCLFYSKNAVVPNNLSETHKKLLEQCDTLTNITLSLSQRKEDPLKMLVEIPKLSKIPQEIKNLAKTYDKYFSGLGIYYKMEESGREINLNTL